LRRGLTGFECPEIQSDLMQEIQFGCGEWNSPANICNLPMTCLKNLCTFALRVCGHTAFPEQNAIVGVCLGSFRGAVPCPAMLSDTLPAFFSRPAPFLPSGRNVQSLKNSAAIAPLGAVSDSIYQFTKRRIRIFITIPSARNMNSTDEPP
jgi:hypothetical protein